MIETLIGLPLYTKLNLALLLASFILCLLAWVGGMAARRLLPCMDSGCCFAQPSFPSAGEQAYTFLFLLLDLYFIFSGALMSHQESGGTNLASTILMALLYLPFIFRFLAMPSSIRQIPGKYYLLPLAVILFTNAASYLYQAYQIPDWLQQWTGTPELQDAVREIEAMQDPKDLALCLFGTLVVAPIGEECAYRGFLYTTLRKQAGPKLAAVFSGLFFGAIHMALPQFLPLAIFGMAQCWLYEKTRTIWLPIITHVLFNLIATIFILSL